MQINTVFHYAFDNGNVCNVVRVTEFVRDNPPRTEYKMRVIFMDKDEDRDELTTHTDKEAVIAKAVKEARTMAKYVYDTQLLTGE